jgi:endoglucanase
MSGATAFWPTSRARDGIGRRRPGRAVAAGPRGLLRGLTALGALLAALAVATPAQAGTANAGLPGAPHGNPLAGMRWGVYTGFGDGLYPAYQGARGTRRALLAKLALRPLAYSFGAWDSDSGAGASVRNFIQITTAGDPRVLSQVVVFRLDPWEGCGLSFSGADQSSYRRWINSFARGIGSSRVALILQPDLPFAMCTGSSAPLQLVAYAAQRLSALPHTTVYLDAGVRYWPMPYGAAVSMLERAGVRYTRGLALNTTEYDSTGAELEYGARLVRSLATAGIPNLHFVINTAENGSPFLNGQYPGNVGNPRVCRDRSDRLCATLGIPPTSNVTALRWGLSGLDRSLAARYADAYLWIGRPWLDFGSGGLDLGRALGLARSTPF